MTSDVATPVEAVPDAGVAQGAAAAVAANFVGVIGNVDRFGRRRGRIGS